MISVFISCKNQKDEVIDDSETSLQQIEVTLKEKNRSNLYEKVKQKKLSTLSEAEKQKTVEEWVSILKSDPDFVNAEKALREFTAEIVSRDRSIDNQGKPVRSDVKEGQLPYFKSRGVRKPEKAATSHFMLIKNIILVLQKYPEFKKMDPATRKLILSNAGNHPQFSDIRRDW